MAASCPTCCAAEVGQTSSGEAAELDRILVYEGTKGVRVSRHMKAANMLDIVEPCGIQASKDNNCGCPSVLKCQSRVARKTVIRTGDEREEDDGVDVVATITCKEGTRDSGV